MGKNIQISNKLLGGLIFAALLVYEVLPKIGVNIRSLAIAILIIVGIYLLLIK